MIFKVAVLQMRSENRAYEENSKTIIKYMTEAKENNADILLLPECFITGYDLTIDNDAAISESDLAVLCDKAKELGIGLVATALTKGNVKPQNAAFVIGKHGEILMKYSKVHTCDFADERVLESGTEFKVCDFDGVKIGIMICYDREYPESARILMLKGTEIILVPNDCVSMHPVCRRSLQERMRICAALRWRIPTAKTPVIPARTARFAGTVTTNVWITRCCSPTLKQRDCSTPNLTWTRSANTASVRCWEIHSEK